MIKFLYYFFLKHLYKIFILNVTPICKNILNKEELKLFNSARIETTHGDLVFNFYIDRRKKRRSRFVKNYIASIKVPERSNSILKSLENYFILIVKINSFLRVNYNILAQLLYDICTEQYLELAKKARMNYCKKCDNYNVCEATNNLLNENCPNKPE